MPLVDSDWDMLESLLAQMDYAKVVGGDTGDAHSVWVGRFVNDVEKPESLHSLSEPLLEIVMKEKMHTFFGQLIGAYPLCIRRCQANRLFNGDFIQKPAVFITVISYKFTCAKFNSILVINIFCIQ